MNDSVLPINRIMANTTFLLIIKKAYLLNTEKAKGNSFSHRRLPSYLVGQNINKVCRNISLFVAHSRYGFVEGYLHD